MNPPAAENIPQPIHLVITWTPVPGKGFDTSMNGPLSNPGLCLEMLASGHKALLGFVAQQAAKAGATGQAGPVVIAPPGMANGLRVPNG